MASLRPLRIRRLVAASQEPGVSAYCSGAPVWIFNGVITASVRANPTLVAELLDAVAGDVSDYCLQVRPGAHGVEEVAQARGMVLGEQEPLMLLEDPDRLASAASVDGLVIRRLRANEVDRHLSVVAAGFSATVELYAAWASSDLLGRKDVTRTWAASRLATLPRPWASWPTIMSASATSL